MNNRIQFKFSTPANPHLNGLAEAGVRMAKLHLTRTFSKEVFTFEEFATILASIESCLNSRPLIPISADKENYDFLTPAHFIINRSMKAIPEDFVPNTKFLDRYNMVKEISQNYWNIFQKEYLNHLQKRFKWSQFKENLQIGSLVLIRSNIVPKSHWPTGRITQLHTGKDGLVRIASYKTPSGEIKKKHIRDLVEIPFENDNLKTLFHLMGSRRRD